MAIRSPSKRCACSAIILHLSMEAYKRRRTSWFDGEVVLPLTGCALSAFRGVAATFFFGLPDRLSLLVTIFMLPEDSSFYRRKKSSRAALPNCHCLSHIIVTDVSGRAGLQARVKGFSRRMEPRRGGTGNKCGCVVPTALGFFRSGFNAGLPPQFAQKRRELGARLKARSTLRPFG